MSKTRARSGAPAHAGSRRDHVHTRRDQGGDHHTTEAADPAAAPRLRVAVSMLSLVPGGMGGSETYARELVRELAGSSRVAAEAWVARIGTGFAAEVPEHVVAGVTGGATTSARLVTLAQARRHRERIRRDLAAADVVHFPFTAPVPWPSGAPRSR